MQSYIDLLLEDLAAAHMLKPPSLASNSSYSVYDHCLEEPSVEWVMHKRPLHSFAYYCGINKEQFPPVERLTDEQTFSISAAFRALLYSWNLGIDLPAQLPLAKSYQFLISVLDKEVEIVNDGAITIEFCTCQPACCPFESYCSCLQYFDQKK